MRCCVGLVSLAVSLMIGVRRIHTRARQGRRRALASCVDADVRLSVWPRGVARRGCGCSDRSLVARRGQIATSTCWSMWSGDEGCWGRPVCRAISKSCCTALYTWSRRAVYATRARAPVSRSNGKRGRFESAARPRRARGHARRVGRTSECLPWMAGRRSRPIEAPSRPSLTISRFSARRHGRCRQSCSNGMPRCRGVM